MGKKKAMNNLSHFTESVIVSFDYDKDTKRAILLVGSKQPGKDVQVINTFNDKTAIDIWKQIYPSGLAE